MTRSSTVVQARSSLLAKDARVQRAKDDSPYWQRMLQRNMYELESIGFDEQQTADVFEKYPNNGTLYNGFRDKHGYKQSCLNQFTISLAARLLHTGTESEGRFCGTLKHCQSCVGSKVKAEMVHVRTRKVDGKLCCP